MIWLERHDQAVNMHRFYAIEISTDLFGACLLIRRWGRVGRGHGQKLVQSFARQSDAEHAKQSLMKDKRRRGYS